MARTNTAPWDHHGAGMIYEESLHYKCVTCDHFVGDHEIQCQRGMCFHCWFSPEMMAARAIREEWELEEDLALKEIDARAESDYVRTCGHPI